MKLIDSLVALRQGAHELRLCTGATRSEMLVQLAHTAESRISTLLDANAVDCRENHDSLEPALYQRLRLTEDKLRTVIAGIRDLARSDDPIGRVQLRTELDQGLVLERISTPLGVVAVIFESRPDVFLQVLALALRTANGIVLKGGREATTTNRAMLQVAQEAFRSHDSFLANWFLLIEGREATEELLQYDNLVDLIIPRGSNDFVRHIQEHSRIPVLGHASGVCHIFVHRDADQDEALTIILDSKTQYPAACNSVETVLVDAAVADTFLPQLATRLREAGVTIRGCRKSASLLAITDTVADTEWSTEYGGLTIAIKTVSDLHEAIQHINHFGSHHTDVIVSKNTAACELFTHAVDSSSVFTNCSSRFADGYRFGFGAEVGIGTGKLHARGPVGIEGLLTYKYILRGHGQVVQSYVGPSARPFRFTRLSTA